MDAEVLSRIQDSECRVQCGGVTGHIAGFKVSGDQVRWLRLRDEDGVEHEVVGGVIELVDEVDDEKVAEVRAARDAEDAAFLAGTAVGAIRDAQREA